MNVVQAVQEFFLTGRTYLSLNSNLMALIPKTKTTLRVEYYRPITMSNFMFKVITSIIADHLGIIFFLNPFTKSVWLCKGV